MSSATFLNVFAELVLLVNTRGAVQRYSRRDLTAPLLLTKNTNSAKIFQKVAVLMLYTYSSILWYNVKVG